MSTSLTVGLVYGFVFDDSADIFESTEEFDGVVMDPVGETTQKIVFVEDSVTEILSTRAWVDYKPVVEVPTERNGRWHRLLVDATKRIHAEMAYPIGEFRWIVLTENS